MIIKFQALVGIVMAQALQLHMEKLIILLGVNIFQFYVFGLFLEET
jgi:hypothetical protein